MIPESGRINLGSCRGDPMNCMHPNCARGGATTTWADVVAHPMLRIRSSQQPGFAAALGAAFGALANPPVSCQPPKMSQSRLKALLALCPCLYNQIDIAASPRAVVHFCEISLGAPITASNVCQAFQIQHPKTRSFVMPPLKNAADGGTVMEMLCSEVLANEGMPAMPLNDEGWPDWHMPGHVLLNEGKMSALRAFGDILVPCAPTNLVISVKSEAARERLLYSANSIEGIGFGFFNKPAEFWTHSRMTLYKRMGFSAIYMPDDTHAAIMSRLDANGTRAHAVNINGTELYRPISIFGSDMRRVAGKSSTLL